MRFNASLVSNEAYEQKFDSIGTNECKLCPNKWQLADNEWADNQWAAETGVEWMSLS